MSKRRLFMLVAGWIVLMQTIAAAQESSMKGMDMHMKHSEKMPPASALKPAEGASVKILSPQNGQAFRGDQVTVEFKLVKAKGRNTFTPTSTAS